MKKLVGLVVVFLLALTLAACGDKDSDGDDGSKDSSGDTPDKLIMGFVPSQDSENIASTIEPLSDRLSEELGIEVEGKVMTNYNALVEALGANQVQIAFIPAFGYILASEQYDVEVILKSMRDGSGTYKAQYLVRTDSGIDSLEDLEGKVWAFPDKTSTAGYLFPAKHLMEELGFDSASALENDFFGNLIEVGGHDTAAEAVLEGDADVATTFDDVRDTLEADYPSIKDDLKVVDYTIDIPNDTVTVPKGLNEELVDQIRQAFLDFNDDPEMIEIMNEVYNWDGIEEAEDAEYEVVRETYHEFRDLID